uniref:Uncharacterized protein n=1 Tax=Zea mays TaxID=4577 RepID=B4FY77_MAIZE|nr:unknown [Zea mays]
MDAAWTSAVNRATGMADSAKRFLLPFRRPPPPPPPCPDPDPNPVQILKRLQRQAFYDIMQLRERQEKVERVISLFKATKVGPFAEESTRVKGVVNVAGSLPRDISEAESCISSRFVFEAPVRKKDSLFAELSTEHRYVSQENDHIETPFVLSKLMYLFEHQ